MSLSLHAVAVCLRWNEKKSQMSQCFKEGKKKKREQRSCHITSGEMVLKPCFPCNRLYLLHVAAVYCVNPGFIAFVSVSLSEKVNKR